MKKLTAFLTALIICTGAVSCKSSTTGKEKQPKNTIAEEMNETAYKKSIIDKPSDMQLAYKMLPYNKGQNYLFCGMGSDGTAFWTADSKLEIFNTLEIPDFGFGTSYDFDVIDDGSIISIVNSVDYGDLPDPDPSAEDYDAEEYDAAAVYTLKIEKYSVDGTLVSSNEIKGSAELIGAKETIISGIAASGDRAFVCINGSYYMLGIDGSVKGKIEGDKLEQIGKDSKGNFICAVKSGESKLKLCTVNPDNAEINDTSVEYEVSASVYGLIRPGTGEYDMFLNSRTAVYGIKSEDASIVTLFSISDSGLNVNSLGDFIMEENGDFIFNETNYSNWSGKIRRYTQCDLSELEDIPVITIGCEDSSVILAEEVEEFNDSQSDYIVKIKEYTWGEEDTILEFTEDLLAGNTPDIYMLFNGTTFGGVDIMEKGACCDLNELIENDSEISRDDFVPNIIDLAEKDGKLYCMPSTFLIDTGTVCKTKYAEGIEDWNNETKLDCIKNLPDGINPESKWERLWQVFEIYDYVDMEKRTCNFDSGVFIDMLNYVNEAAVLEPEYSDEEEDIEATVKRNKRFLEDREILNTYESIGNYSDCLRIEKGVFGEPVTYLGDDFTANFMDMYAVSESSENKELAWDFIKSRISDENFAAMSESGAWWGFPITKSAMKIRLDEDLTYDSDSEKGVKICYSDMYDEKYTVNLGEITQEYIDKTDDIISMVNKGNLYNMYLPYECSENIIYNELRNFMEGGCSAEQCADILQSKVTIYLSEQG